MKTSLLLLLLLPLCAIAQTGPAGVGTTDGTSFLKIWLAAEDLDGDGDTSDNPADASKVSSWVDKSGNGFTYSQSGTIRPTYRAGSPSAVDFQASLSSHQNLVGSANGSYQGGSAFLVTNAVDYGGASTTFLDGSGYSLRVEQYNGTNRVGYTRYGVQDYATSLTTVTGSRAIYSWHKSSSSSSVEIRLNGSRQSINVGATTVGLPYDRIGGSTSGVDEASGLYHEVLLYNTRLTDVQLYLVENYLSAKYGTIAVQYDIYDQDNPANGNYDFDVAGIGRSTANQHTDARGTGIVRMLNPGNLDINEYLIWGHDNGALASTVVDDLPAGLTSRLERVWRVSESSPTGTSVNVGSVDIRFDLTALGAVNASDLRLLVDLNNNGIFSDDAPIAGATSLGGGTFQFSGVTALSDNLRFTVGTAAASLPVDLLSFTADAGPEGVRLTWATAQEWDNRDFTVQRSRDGKSWDGILTVAGAGHSDVAVTYHALDADPVRGISFYRLRQTDFDGTSNYSATRMVNIDASPATFDVFPNPATDHLVIQGEREEITSIRIFNGLGQDVTRMVTLSAAGTTRREVDLTRLPRGAYSLISRSGSRAFTKQ